MVHGLTIYHVLCMKRLKYSVVDVRILVYLEVVERGGQRRAQGADAAQSRLVGVVRPRTDAGGAEAACRAGLYSSRGPSLCVCSQHCIPPFHAGDSGAQTSTEQKTPSSGVQLKKIMRSI